MTRPTPSDPARTEVLARIREALADPVPPADVPRDYRRATAREVDVVARFAERVADYRATVIRTSPAALPATIGATLRDRRIRRLVVPAGIPPAWFGDIRGELLHDEPPLSRLDLDAADGVLTTCALAIAETGTIVLDGGAGQGRRALSLLPDYHCCVVLSEQVVGDVPEAIARLDPRRPMTWISGPSATSDIELQRVEGVHGPRTLDVVLVNPG